MFNIVMTVYIFYFSEVLRDNRTDSFLRAVSGQLRDKSTQMVSVNWSLLDEILLAVFL